MMQREDDLVYGAVYRLLDELRTAQVVPVGALGTIYSSIDQLWSSRAPAEHIAVAEGISIAMLRWESARRNGDGGAEESAQADLKALTKNWLEMRLPRSAVVPLSTNLEEPTEMELSDG
jgi:hypothetical protein